MSGLNPATDAALKQPVAMVGLLVTVELPSVTIRWLFGSGVVSYASQIYQGDHPDYGSIYAIDDLMDGSGEDAPTLTMSISPKSDAAAATLAGAGNQGSPVSLVLAAINPANGLVIGDPYPLFEGEIDVPRVRFSERGYDVEFEVVSALERMFNRYDGARLAPAFHENIWPGEKGFSQLHGAPQAIYWSMDKPKGAGPSMSNGGLGGPGKWYAR